MRFGVVIGAPTRAEYLAEVRRAEALDYDVVLCSDHLHLNGRHFSHFAPIPALTAAALSTERIRDPRADFSSMALSVCPCIYAPHANIQQ